MSESNKDIFYLDDPEFRFRVREAHPHLLFEKLTKEPFYYTNLAFNKAKARRLQKLDLHGRNSILSLEGIENFANIKSLDITGIAIDHLPAISSKLETLYLVCDSLLTMEDFPDTITSLYFNAPLVEVFPTLPKKLDFFYLTTSPDKLPKAYPDSLKDFHLKCKGLTEVPFISSLNKFSVIDAAIPVIKNIPKNVTSLWWYSSIVPIKGLELSEDMENLFISDSMLPDLKNLKLPARLKKLSIQNCGLSTLPELPDTLESLDIAYNNFTHFPLLPKNLKVFQARENPIIEYPVIPKSVIYTDDY